MHPPAPSRDQAGRGQAAFEDPGGGVRPGPTKRGVGAGGAPKNVVQFPVKKKDPIFPRPLAGPTHPHGVTDLKISLVGVDNDTVANNVIFFWH